MKAPEAGQPLNLEAIAEQVVALMVTTFGFPEAEARQRITLWRAQQHSLEGQALESLLPGMTPEKQAQELLRWALEGQFIEDDLRRGAAALDFDPDPPPD